MKLNRKINYLLLVISLLFVSLACLIHGTPKVCTQKTKVHSFCYICLTKIVIESIIYIKFMRLL